VMHSDKQNLFLTTFKKWVLAKKSGQIPHSAMVRSSPMPWAMIGARDLSTSIPTRSPKYSYDPL